MSVILGAWDRLRADARPLRSEVFIDEQRVPVELEWDDDDATALHAVAYAADGPAVATGRLLCHASGVARIGQSGQIGRIGRMAVRRAWRGQGIGTAVLAALMQAARQRGDAEVRLHAQLSAVAFYRRAGFTAHGDTFMDAGIAHVEMQRPLPAT